MMISPPAARAPARLVALGFTAVVVLICITTAFPGGRSKRTFHLHFQLADFIVPVGEMWRLSWKSPYQAGDICPSYDVRVAEGNVCLGAKGEIQASAYAARPGKNGSLDLSATAGEATVWLDSGTKFSTANDLFEIDVCTFTNSP